LKRDTCKFESSKKREIRAQEADASNAYRKSRAFNCHKANGWSCSTQQKLPSQHGCDCLYQVLQGDCIALNC